MIGIISFNIVFADSYYLDQFQPRLTESSNQDTSMMLLSVIDDEDER
jgi:hypothetical protein